MNLNSFSGYVAVDLSSMMILGRIDTKSIKKYDFRYSKAESLRYITSSTSFTVSLTKFMHISKIIITSMANSTFRKSV